MQRNEHFAEFDGLKTRRDGAPVEVLSKVEEPVLDRHTAPLSGVPALVFVKRSPAFLVNKPSAGGGADLCSTDHEVLKPHRVQTNRSDHGAQPWEEEHLVKTTSGENSSSHTLID